ncbi:unnamed protein product [Dracunculus medinensis]|uniref:Cse1 domain-containing protein n=1 Tax=Dracunculus medinensis TaxID=318479 RepID=A0A0N4UFI6_DRAME|nr:unnamed protein product [Dracunculus medinensis]
MQIRAQLLDFMFKAPANIRLQLSEIVCVMSKYDFPDCWPELLNLLKEILTMNDANRLLAALTTMDELFKRYRHEMKSEKLWNEIYIVLKELAPPLTILFTNVLQYVSTESVEKTKEKYDEMLNILHLIMEIFHSLNVQDLPEHFEDTISGWMEGLGTILKLKIDSVESAYSDDEPGTLDKLKCCVCDILTLYSQRYEEEFMPFINVVIEIVWEQLMGLDARVSINKFRFDAFFTSALTFLSAICVKQRYANIFQMDGVLTSITENIILKNLVTRPTDLEQFEDEPLEYIKKDLEGKECSNDLQQNWLKKDLVYCLILAVGAKTETVKFGATTLSNFVSHFLNFLNESVK